MPARTKHRTTVAVESRGAVAERAAVMWAPLAAPAAPGHSLVLPLPLRSPMMGNEAGRQPFGRERTDTRARNIRTPLTAGNRISIRVCTTPLKFHFS
ncbi:hypothetical protein E2C01_033049 [Portunus trituberculatus]|uniref:Uncharacterized protein n=1 Tax=Portunus trituberculatus TaxID=210409 RepID=A0A5B7EZ47_PORTR|nr:hypothetical protein [Portunus trituberculatus]